MHNLLQAQKIKLGFKSLCLMEPEPDKFNFDSKSNKNVKYFTISYQWAEWSSKYDTIT